MAHPRPPWSKRRSTAILLVVVSLLVSARLVLATGATTTVDAADPWTLVSLARNELQSGSPLEARFTQTFLPSGFSTGDLESGALYVDLPLCIRFEYTEPFPKNFLLCGDWVYTWNPGEVSGRRFLATDDEAEGLDLLRLEVDELETRYRAELAPNRDERTVVNLISMDPEAEIRAASLELDRRQVGAATHSLHALAYEDRSGNRTRFEISGYRPLAEVAVLRPPALEWLED
ncbi:MAG: outer membrane lipoprotein carrier protein LolA [Thermoanaerobaculia bacterium]